MSVVLGWLLFQVVARFPVFLFRRYPRADPGPTRDALLAVPAVVDAAPARA